MALMGFREYARHRGVALRAVQKAITAGRITVVGEGRDRRIDSDQADRDWQQNTDPAKQSLLHSAGLPALDPDDGADEEAAQAVNDTAEYRAARAQREQVRLESERIDLELKRGSVVEAQQAKRLVFTAFRSLRDAVLQVPARVKDRCAAAPDALQVEKILDAELAEVFAGFDHTRALREVKDDDDEEDAAD